MPKGIRREIIVCANGCTDQTARIVKAMAAREKQIKLVEVPEPGKARAMNLIAQNARPSSSTILFCDADVHLEEDALFNLLQTLRNKPRLHAVSALPLFFERPDRNWVEAMAAAGAKTDAWNSLTGHFFLSESNTLRPCRRGS